MNMQAMMAQARKLQKEIEKTTNEIDSTEYEYDNENIRVVCLGNYKVKSIDIKNDSILEDKEMLEDIVLVAMNDVLKKIEADKNKKLGKYTNGLGGLF
jgi:DNA-binding YbaB/EbfC family protein